MGIRLLGEGEPVVPSTPGDPGSLRLLLSSAGSLSDPVLSPDGSTVAYVSQEGGQADIFVRRIEGGRPVRITDDAVRELELDFSHAGDRLAFVRVRPGRTDRVFH